MTTGDFLAQVQAIADEQPVYRLGGDGSDGSCDCIGLIIGACRRCGVEWPGIHGSNWAARNVTDSMSRIPRASALSPGDLVYKALKPSSSGYDLPARYAAHFDTKDYYHVGVVTGVSPLRITHCTSPHGIAVDTRLGHWQYSGRLTLLEDSADAHVLPATVRKGSRGSAVTQLQLLLRQEGYSLQPDGIFGPMTLETVRSFQTSSQLAADGIVGPLTWHALLRRKEESSWKTYGNT